MDRHVGTKQLTRTQELGKGQGGRGSLQEMLIQTGIFLLGEKKGEVRRQVMDLILLSFVMYPLLFTFIINILMHLHSKRILEIHNEKFESLFQCMPYPLFALI